MGITWCLVLIAGVGALIGIISISEIIFLRHRLSLLQTFFLLHFDKGSTLSASALLSSSIKKREGKDAIFERVMRDGEMGKREREKLGVEEGLS